MTHEPELGVAHVVALATDDTASTIVSELISSTKLDTDVNGMS